MIWLFALGIIWLMIVHDTFRKVMFWILGISAGLTAVAVAAMALYTK